MLYYLVVGDDMKKSILFGFLACLMLLGITGCGNKTNVSSKNDQANSNETETAKQENMGSTMVDDDRITIIYYEKNMKGKYPSVHFHVKNNSQNDLRIEPLGIIHDLNMTGRFIISNSEGKWASPYIEFKPGESYDVYFGYMDNYSQQQLDMEKFVNMDLTFYVSENNNGSWSHVKDYQVHID